MDPNVPDLDLPSKQESITLIIALGFGIWGGIAKYLNEVTKEKRQFYFFELVMYGFTSGFCGLLVGLMAIHYNQDKLLIYFLAGIGGGMGWQTVNWFISIAKRKAAAQLEILTAAEEKENG